MPIPRRLQRTQSSASTPASMSGPSPAPQPASTSGSSPAPSLAALSQLAELVGSNGALPSRPKNLAELKELLAAYGPLMNPESRALVTETLEQLESGADLSSLQSLAQRLQQALPGG